MSKSLIRVYHPSLSVTLREKSIVHITDEESNHLKSFRLRPDETFQLFNGKGVRSYHYWKLIFQLIATASFQSADLSSKSKGKKHHNEAEVVFIQRF